MFRNLLSVYWSSIPSHDMENHVLFGQPGPFWMTGDMLGCPYFMFVVHIHFFSFLKTILDVTGLGRPLWTKITCC